MSSSAPPLHTSAPTEISAAEQRPSARVGAVLFRHRGWLPVPFLLVPLLARGTMQPRNWVIGFVLLMIGEAIRLAGVAAGMVTRRRSHRSTPVTYGIFVDAELPTSETSSSGSASRSSRAFWFLPVAHSYSRWSTLIVGYEEGVLESIFGEEYLAHGAARPPAPPFEPRGG